MELLEGVTLKNYIKSKGGLLPRREAMNFAMQICRALEHAHSKHVVHRDIKPQNIVLTDSGKIKVADFGIARAANNTTTVNSGQYAVGSAHYLSPEQARGGYTDHRSDIYSFGVVMYELFTGKLPFDAEESISVVMQHIHDEPTRPCEVNPDITPGIEAIIMRAMCKEQRLRYASATEILEDLVTVYQDPSVSVSSLNAYDGEATAHTEKKMPRNAGRNHRNARNKKKNTHKNLLIAAISLFSVFILSIILVIYVFFGETGKEYAIPDFTGMTFEEAAIEAERNSNKDVTFTVSIAEEVFSDEEKGKIIDQNPDGGFKIKTKREIKLTVSRGPVLIKLADYTGKDCAEIQKMLEEKGLSVVIEQEDSNTYEEGKIIKHLPSKDTQMGEGDEITLFVSKGAENTYVPDVVGSTQQEAIVEIERNNLEVKVVEEDSSTVIKGEVIRQGKKANSVVPTGTVIEIYVSTGKPKADESQNSDKTTSSTPQKPKKASVSLTALSKTAPTKVKIMLDGKKVYEADVTTTSGNATVTFDVTAGVDISHGADIYYNDTYIATKEVK
ncbi:MAG: PASTA domain-containing protein [Clostridia bacterium]|nr:PASTA domain-containing protein [Clostridia bacterium]